MATRLQKLIGGLLGEDVESMSEEERQRLTREGGLSALAGMLTGSGLIGGLGAYGAGRQAKREQEAKSAQEEAAAQDIQQAQAAIAGRLGAKGMDVGRQTRLEEVRPMSGMNLPALIASPAGAAAMQVNPQLAEMMKQRTGYQVAGADIFNRETGQFMPRPATAPRGAQVSVGGGRVAPAAGAPADSGMRFRTLTQEEIAANQLPAGTSAQLDTQTGSIKILSAVPTQQRTGEAGKGTALDRIDALTGRIVSQLDKVRTGGPLGVAGALSQIFDSQDAKLFESYRQQLSSALRTALRIPGEGALSDREQAQYGLQLPELGQSKENNLAILNSLREQVGIAAGKPAASAPAAAPAAPAQFIYRNGRLVPAQPR